MPSNGRARVRRLGAHDLAFEHAEPLRRPVKASPRAWRLRHGGRRAAGRRGSPPRAGAAWHRLADGLTVEALHREPLLAASCGTCSTRASSARSGATPRPGSRSGTSERPPRSTKSAASPSSSTTYAPATRAARAPARFGQGSAAPYGCAGSPPRSRAALFLRPFPQPLDRAGKRELRAAQPFDEVPAPADAEGLELRSSCRRARSRRESLRLARLRA